MRSSTASTGRKLLRHKMTLVCR